MNKGEIPHGMLRARVLLPPRALLLSIIGQAVVTASYWPPEFDSRKALAGVSVMVVGSALNVWAVLLFRRGQVGVCPFSPAPVLIAEGPYRLTRNPMYLGLVLICCGAALLTGLEWNLLFAAALAVWLHVRFVLPEEAFLKARLEQPYLQYASCTARWFGLPGDRSLALTAPPVVPSRDRGANAGGPERFLRG